MMDARDRHLAAQAARVAHIPSEADFEQMHAQADELARQWSSDSEYLGCMLLMRIRAAEVEVFSAMTYCAGARGATRTFELPRRIEVEPAGKRATSLFLAASPTSPPGTQAGWA
jgi:hypothetical protein